MIGKAEFNLLARNYRRRYQAALVCVDADGQLIFGRPACGRRKNCHPDCAASRRGAVMEALRWGEPSITTCPENFALWAIPLMENSRVYGGLVAIGIPLDSDHLRWSSSSTIAAS